MNHYHPVEAVVAEAIRCGMTNLQAAMKARLEIPGARTTSKGAASVRSKLKRAGVPVPSSVAARRRQRG